MRASLAAGAAIVNDVTALTGDPESLELVSVTTAPVVLMHMAGEPRTMQQAPSYDDVVLDVYDALAARISACEAAGIARDRICVEEGNLTYGVRATPGVFTCFPEIGEARTVSYRCAGANLQIH